MKDNMKDVDGLIKETLSMEEAAFYDSLEEQGLFKMIGGLYRGKNAWFIITTHVLSIVLVVGLVYCIVQFVQSTTAVAVARWGLISVAILLFVSMLKIYSWLQMDRQALLREIKRIEILILSHSPKTKN